ncbi:hypothetical protein VP277E431_P0015 [Vibrio phage 277E43-1]|nr:hypothetical protein VP277E431_P0015 [Vibrio phage 277E43-1]
MKYRIDIILALTLGIVTHSIADERDDYKTQDMLPGYVCMTSDQVKEIQESSRQIGFSEGYYLTRQQVANKSVEMLEDACLTGSGTEVVINQNLTMICK